MKKLRAWIRTKRRQETQNGRGKAYKASSKVAAGSTSNGRQLKNEATPVKLLPGAAPVQPETKQLVTPVEPGQAWINFRFQQTEVMKHLAFR